MTYSKQGTPPTPRRLPRLVASHAFKALALCLLLLVSAPAFAAGWAFDHYESSGSGAWTRVGSTWSAPHVSGSAAWIVGNSSFNTIPGSMTRSFYASESGTITAVFTWQSTDPNDTPGPLYATIKAYAGAIAGLSCDADDGIGDKAVHMQGVPGVNSTAVSQGTRFVQVPSGSVRVIKVPTTLSATATTDSIKAGALALVSVSAAIGTGHWVGPYYFTNGNYITRLASGDPSTVYGPPTTTPWPGNTTNPLNPDTSSDVPGANGDFSVTLFTDTNPIQGGSAETVGTIQPVFFWIDPTANPPSSSSHPQSVSMKISVVADASDIAAGSGLSGDLPADRYKVNDGLNDPPFGTVQSQTSSGNEVVKVAVTPIYSSSRDDGVAGYEALGPQISLDAKATGSKIDTSVQLTAELAN